MASCRTKLSGGRILVQKKRCQLNRILKPYWTHTLRVLTHNFWHKPWTHTEPGLNPYFARINSLFLLMVLVGMAANVCMVREGASWTRDDNEIHHTLIFHGLKPKEQQLVFFKNIQFPAKPLFSKFSFWSRQGYIIRIYLEYPEITGIHGLTKPGYPNNRWVRVKSDTILKDWGFKCSDCASKSNIFLETSQLNYPLVI